VRNRRSSAQPDPDLPPVDPVLESVLPWGWTRIEPEGGGPAFWIGFEPQTGDVWYVDPGTRGQREGWWMVHGAAGGISYTWGRSPVQALQRGKRRIEVEARQEAVRAERNKRAWRIGGRDPLVSTWWQARYGSRKRMYRERAAIWRKLPRRRLP